MEQCLRELEEKALGTRGPEHKQPSLHLAMEW